MGILFYNRQDFWEQTKFFGKRVSFRKKRMIAEQNGWLRKKKRHKERTKQKHINERFKYCFLLNEQIFQKILKRTTFWSKILKKMFYWMDYFFEQSFEKNNRFLLLNKRFYWTNDFTEWSLSEKTNENIENFGNERNHILLTIKKKTNKMDCSRTKNERNEKKV